MHMHTHHTTNIVYLDCGIAKYNPNKKQYNKAWTRVNGMMRIGSKYEKKSLHRKFIFLR